MIRKYMDKENRFVEVFDTNTGRYIRSGVLDENGKDTNKDPFMRSFPGLLDIGIMGGCKAATSGVCRAGGKHSGCYQGGRKYDPNKDMTLENYKRIIDEGAKNGLMQVALGGAGNPNDHAHFAEICEYTRKQGIVPNYTTAGIGLTNEAVQATKKYCGAVAVSWYGQQFTVDALHKFIDAGCKTNIHYVISKETIKEAIALLKTHKLPYDNGMWDFNKDRVNAFIFLLYKPVGLGTQDNVLSLDNDKELVQEFFDATTSVKHPFKVGFDSCSIPAVVRFSKHVDLNSVDTCEGGRYSAYISADMQMVPCSFDQNLHWAVDLHAHTVKEAWQSDKFKDFRSHLANSCPNCKQREYCMGGCPIKNEIVLCDSKERNN